MLGDLLVYLEGLQILIPALLYTCHPLLNELRHATGSLPVGFPQLIFLNEVFPAIWPPILAVQLQLDGTAVVNCPLARSARVQIEQLYLVGTNYFIGGGGVPGPPRLLNLEIVAELRPVPALVQVQLQRELLAIFTQHPLN